MIYRMTDENIRNSLFLTQVRFNKETFATDEVGSPFSPVPSLPLSHSLSLQANNNIQSAGGTFKTEESEKPDDIYMLGTKNFDTFNFAKHRNTILRDSEQQSSKKKRELTFGNESSGRGSNATANFRKSTFMPPRLSLSIQDEDDEDAATNQMITEEMGSNTSFNMEIKKHED